MCVFSELPGASSKKVCPPATATGVDELEPEAPLSPSYKQSAQESELRTHGQQQALEANLMPCPVLHLKA